jgi:hypothetical protein
LTDAETSAGIEAATVVMIAPDNSEQATATDADGRYQIKSVPGGATIRFSSAEYGIAEEPVGERTEGLSPMRQVRRLSALALPHQMAAPSPSPRRMGRFV